MKYLWLITKLEDGGAPTWVLLFKEGQGQLETGEQYLIDRQSYDLIASHMKKRGNEIVWDYEHQTLTGGKAPAAGWIKDLRYDDGIGIMAQVDWTEDAASYIAKKEYRYFSPVFGVRSSDHRVTGLHSVALTNTPKTNNLQPLVAKLAGITPAEQGEPTMELSMLIAKLGLPADATEADVLKKLGEIAAQSSKTVDVVAKSVLDALGLKDGDDVSTVVASIHALKQTEKTQVSKAEFDALTKKLLEREVTDIVAKAMTEGKITPDQKEWATGYATSDLKGFETFIAKAPAVIPMDKLNGLTKKTEDILIDDTTVNVAKMMGVSIEDIKKHSQPTP